MPRSFPPEVLFCDYESLLFTRFSRGRGAVRLANAKRYPIGEGTFEPGMLTPSLVNPLALTDALMRVRREQGKLDKVSLLLPDTWFRIAVFDLPSLPSKKAEADDVVRWSLRKTLPLRPEEFRMAHHIVRQGTGGAQALVVAALEKTILAIESAFAAAQMEVSLIEPAGLNLWNAIAVKAQPTAEDRVLLYLRDRDFTSALFRAGAPIFVRSRTLGNERTLQQEIRLSASYFRANLQSEKVDCCYIASDSTNGDFAAVVAEEFSAPARHVALADYVELAAAMETRGFETELIACAGVFTA
jgi:hypothetical protein